MTEPHPNPRNTMPPMPSLLSMPTPQPMYQSYYHAPLPAGYVPTTLHNMPPPPPLYMTPHANNMTLQPAPSNTDSDGTKIPEVEGQNANNPFIS